jgi:hypothetical protein
VSRAGGPDMRLVILTALTVAIVVQASLNCAASAHRLDSEWQNCTLADLFRLPHNLFTICT